MFDNYLQEWYNVCVLQVQREKKALEDRLSEIEKTLGNEEERAKMLSKVKNKVRNRFIRSRRIWN